MSPYIGSLFHCSPDPKEKRGYVLVSREGSV